MTDKKTDKKSPENKFVTPLKIDDHANLKFAGCDDCTKCCDGSVFTVANVLLNELFDTAKLFPIVFFQKDKQLSMSLIYTLKRGIPCPYLNLENGWCLVYDSVRPRACKTYPFNVHGNARAGGGISYSVTFDSRCPALREREDGEPLIQNGQLSEKIVNGFIDPNVLKDHSQNIRDTQEFLKLVGKHELLKKIEYEIDPGQGYGRYDGYGKQRALFPFWQISRKKLAGLDAAAVMEFHKNHYFNAIYTHLNSLGNMKKLEETKAAHEKESVDILTFSFG